MLGQKVRELRQKNEKTLNNMSEITGLTASYLSQLERDMIEPSLSSLRKIAKALGVPIYTFLDEEPEKQVVIRKDQRKKLDLPNSSITYEFLTPMGHDRDSIDTLEVIYYELDPDSWSSDDFIIHEADECIFVLEGTMNIYLGEDHYVIEKGDSIMIRQNIPHRMFNPSKDVKAIGVSAMSPAVY